MSFEPQKFYLGVVDFFAVILPGGILTFLVKDSLGHYLIGDPYYQLTGPKGWVAFLGASYLLGHFVFLVGAGLLDDFAYDPLRRATYGAQISRLAKNKRLSLLLLRWLARIFFQKESDQAMRQAVKIKEHYAGEIDAADAINAYQWSKAKLTLERSAAIEHVHRFEADSKFFRSVVVLCILIIAGLAPFNIVRDQVAWASIAVLVLSFWRYVDQRLKATTQSYWYMITLEGRVDSPLRLPAFQLSPHGPTHGGGVVFRRRGQHVEYLLVRPKEKPDEWLLPKGHIEASESPEETAVREVREEAGVWARVIDKLARKTLSIKGLTWSAKDSTLSDKERTINVQFYLMEAADHRLDLMVSSAAFMLSKLMWWVDPKDRDRRRRQWFLLEEAIANATHEDSKKLIKQAEAMRLALLKEASPTTK